MLKEQIAADVHAAQDVVPPGGAVATTDASVASDTALSSTTGTGTGTGVGTGMGTSVGAAGAGARSNPPSRVGSFVLDSDVARLAAPLP